MSGFNYSKWDNIELSDDEKDCHPNIDKDSWFRMKHRARVEREEKEADEKSKLEKANAADHERIDEITQRLVDETDEADREALEEEMRDLEAGVEKREARLADMEKNKKWNVDNMCHVVEERTLIGDKKDTTVTSELPPHLAQAQAARRAATEGAAAAEVLVGPTTETAHIESYSEFVETHDAMMEQFVAIRSLEESKNFLHQHGDVLLQEHASSYILLSCLEEEMNGNHEKMRQVAHQSQLLSHICELAVSLKRPPRDVVVPFFRRIQEPEHLAGFKDAVAGFVDRIAKRAVDKRREMDEERARRAEQGGEEEEVELTKEERMGPGGLDPVEVFETLPESMQRAFESKDIPALQAALQEMPVEEAKYHMKRCEDSGLWVK